MSTGPHKLDPVKGAVAGAINARVTSTAMREVIESDPDLDLNSVEIQIISPTEWQFRVRTNHHGVRYFALKLREMM